MNSLIPVLGISMTIDPPVSSTVAVESPSLYGGLMGKPSINDYIFHHQGWMITGSTS
jgi:hypothetical protein